MIARALSLIAGGTVGGFVGFARATQLTSVTIPVPVATPSTTVTLDTVIAAFAAIGIVWILRQFIETRDNSRRLIVYAFGQPEENGKGGMTGMFAEQKERTAKLEEKTSIAISAIQQMGTRLSNLPCRDDRARDEQCEMTD
jgi:hypothetical protein